LFVCVLQEIGAVFDNPSGWKEKVMEEVAKREGDADDKAIHPVSIYTYRKELAAELSGKIRRNARSRNLKDSMVLQSYRKIMEFAKTVGGLDSLAENVKLLQSLK
jgi:predicted alpha-1,6-mannanase (GH76 family)